MTALGKSVAISKIEAENFLSLQNVELSLGPLTVLVGPNGVGKSNILKLFQFLGDVARRDLLPAIDAFGGFDQLFFRSSEKREKIIRLHLTGRVTAHSSERAPDEYKLSFWTRTYRGGATNEPRRMVQRTESIVLKRTPGRGRRITLSGNSVKFEDLGRQVRRNSPTSLSVQGASTGLATLRRLGEEYEATEIEALAQVFEQLRLFEIDVDRIRRPTRYNLASKLRPDASNLASFLHWLSQEAPIAFERLCEDVRFVLPAFIRFEIVEIGGADDGVRVDLVERHLTGATPLARASFGTIRSIALFAMLHDPSPPRLTCLEEIDHGLHPHALDRLVDRLREASEKTQIILATHSPALVNRLSPEELVVVERDPENSATRIVRLNAKDVAKLQDDTGYGLGELWFSGTLGGAL